MGTPVTARSVCFGPFQVDPRTRELRRRHEAHSRPAAIAQNLIALLEARGPAASETTDSPSIPGSGWTLRRRRSWVR